MVREQKSQSERGKKAFRDRPGYGLFGIVQGSIFPSLRAESAKALLDSGAVTQAEYESLKAKALA